MQDGSSPANNRALWVAALRSGEYRQTIGTLEDAEGFCCLGVACRVAMDHGLSLDRQTRDGTVYYNNEDCYLPDEVVKWLGLGGRTGPLVEATHKDCILVETIADCNDMLGWDFNKIADAIEAGKVVFNE